MPAAALRLKVTVEANRRASVPGGELVDQWEPVRAGVWLGLQGAGGGEAQRGPQLEAAGTLLGRTRYFAGASPQMRLVAADGRQFHVVDVGDQDGRRRWLDWTLTEVSP